MTLPKAVLFDLDNTLAASFSTPTTEITASFETLLSCVPLALVTAANMERIQKYFLSSLSPSADLSNLFILPNSSAEAFRFEEGTWKKIYAHTFSAEEQNAVCIALENSFAAHGWNAYPVKGERIIARPSQITVAALGIEAPDTDKETFDHDRTKREAVRFDIAALFPDLEERVGGRTAIDINPKGVDKAHGVLWLTERLSCTPSQMLYIGDSFHPGGNDEAVIPTGIVWKSIEGPHETEVVLRDLIAQFTR